MISNPNRAECKLYNVLKALNTFYTIMDNTKWSCRRQLHYMSTSVVCHTSRLKYDEHNMSRRAFCSGNQIRLCNWVSVYINTTKDFNQTSYIATHKKNITTHNSNRLSIVQIWCILFPPGFIAWSHPPSASHRTLQLPTDSSCRRCNR